MLRNNRVKNRYSTSSGANVPALAIKYKDPQKLRLRDCNPRTHSPRQLKQIAKSIQEFGFVNAILIDQYDCIIAGHGRVLAARTLKLPDVPTVEVGHLSPAQIRAYVIADNKLAENAGWDRKLLAWELEELSVNLNFDVTITGFEPGEVDIIIGEARAANDGADLVPEIDRSIPSVTQASDLWRIGKHHLICGDALLAANYDKVLLKRRAQMAFIDPPYNVPIEGHVSGKGKATHSEFAMASGEMSSTQFTTFLEKIFSRLVSHSANGSIHFVCMDWRHMGDVIAAGRRNFSELKNLCVWTKTNGGMGSLYRSQHELVFVFKNGDAKHINNVELGRFGRNRTNVWEYAGANTFSHTRDADLAMHPTVKPLALVSDAILDCSKRGGLILDNFAGSGTTLLAAERTGRVGAGIEIDPHYVDVTLQRFKEHFGLNAWHTDLNLSFDEVRALRSAKKGQQHEKGKTQERKRHKARGKSAP